MPKIRVYEQQVDFAPVQANTNREVYAPTQETKSRAGLGQAISGFADALQKRNEANDISDSAKKLAQINDQFTTEYETALDESVNGTDEPQDPRKFAEEFMSKYEKRIAEARSGTSTAAGQQYFDRSASQMHSQFVQKAAATAGELSRTKAINNYNQTVDTYSSKLMRSPSDFEFDVGEVNSSLDALVGRGLNAPQVEKLKLQARKKLSEGAVRGWIRADPEDAQKQLDDGVWDNEITSDLKKQLYGEVDNEIRSRKADARQAKLDEKELHKEDQMKIENDFIAKFIKGGLRAREVSASLLDPEKKRIYLNMIEENQKAGGIKTDPATFSKIWEAIHAPEGTPGKITKEEDLYQYVTQRKLAPEQLDFFRKELGEKKSLRGQLESDNKANFVAMAKGWITKSNPLQGKIDYDGDRRATNFTYFVNEEILKRREAGQSIAPLFDEKSPEYLGNFVHKFQKPAREAMKARSKAFNGVVFPTNEAFKRKADESIDDYEKRKK